MLATHCCRTLESMGSATDGFEVMRRCVELTGQGSTVMAEAAITSGNKHDYELAHSAMFSRDLPASSVIEFGIYVLGLPYESADSRSEAFVDAESLLQAVTSGTKSARPVEVLEARITLARLFVSVSNYARARDVLDGATRPSDGDIREMTAFQVVRNLSKELAAK